MSCQSSSSETKGPWGRPYPLGNRYAEYIGCPSRLCMRVDLSSRSWRSCSAVCLVTRSLSVADMVGQASLRGLPRMRSMIVNWLLSSSSRHSLITVGMGMVVFAFRKSNALGFGAGCLVASLFQDVFRAQGPDAAVADPVEKLHVALVPARMLAVGCPAARCARRSCHDVLFF